MVRTLLEMVLLNCGIFFILLSTTTELGTDRHKNREKYRRKEVVIALSKGTQCYNCLSHDHPGCWEPEHPDYSNITIPNTDCYMPGVRFTCIVITAESARLVDTDRKLGPVRARTCVSSKDFKRRRVIPYGMCERLARELATSEVFSRVRVFRPKCTLCLRPLCVGTN